MKKKVEFLGGWYLVELPCFCIYGVKYMGC